MEEQTKILDIKLMNKFLKVILDLLHDKTLCHDTKLRIETNNSKNYTAYHFTFDMSVDKFESFIIIYDEEISNDWKEIFEEFKEIRAKVLAIQSS